MIERESETFVFASTGNPTKGDPLDGSQAKPHPRSFRDMVIGNREVPPVRPRADLLGSNLAKIVYEDNNRLKPKVFFDEKIVQELSLPWQDSLIIKLLGKSVGYTTMKERLTRLWKPSGGFELMDVDNGYYIVKLDEAADKEKIIANGPWMLFDHYLAVQQWSPDFASPSARVDKTLVWIRFPGLSFLYYDESALLTIAAAVGNPIKVDQTTLKFERGKFARVCVEVDLTQPVIGKVWVGGNWYKVEYEGLHLICAKCGCYGHMARDCKMQKATVKPTAQEAVAGGAGGSSDLVVEKNQIPVKSQHAVTGVDKDDSVSITESAKSNANNMPELNTNNVPESIINEGTKDEDLHGEWLVVTRKKRNNKQKSKGKDIVKGGPPPLDPHAGWNPFKKGGGDHAQGSQDGNGKKQAKGPRIKRVRGEPEVPIQQLIKNANRPKIVKPKKIDHPHDDGPNSSQAYLGGEQRPIRVLDHKKTHDTMKADAQALAIVTEKLPKVVQVSQEHNDPQQEMDLAQ